MSSVSLPDEVRVACARVMERARFVAIDEEGIETYVRGLRAAAGVTDSPTTDRDSEAAAAFAICMNAIDFGSGWWPTIRKRPGHSGYATMAAGVRERFASHGPWSAEELAAMDAATIAGEAGELLPHGSPEEVELRAAAVRAVELIAAATGGERSPAEIDSALWNRGRGRRYKATPRPRSPTRPTDRPLLERRR